MSSKPKPKSRYELRVERLRELMKLLPEAGLYLICDVCASTDGVDFDIRKRSGRQALAAYCGYLCIELREATYFAYPEIPADYQMAVASAYGALGDDFFNWADGGW